MDKSAIKSSVDRGSFKMASIEISKRLQSCFCKQKNLTRGLYKENFPKYLWPNDILKMFFMKKKSVIDKAFQKRFHLKKTFKSQYNFEKAYDRGFPWPGHFSEGILRKNIFL